MSENVRGKEISSILCRSLLDVKRKEFIQTAVFTDTRCNWTTQNSKLDCCQFKISEVFCHEKLCISMSSNFNNFGIVFHFAMERCQKDEVLQTWVFVKLYHFNNWGISNNFIGRKTVYLKVKRREVFLIISWCQLPPNCLSTACLALYTSLFISSHWQRNSEPLLIKTRCSLGKDEISRNQGWILKLC